MWKYFATKQYNGVICTIANQDENDGVQFQAVITNYCNSRIQHCGTLIQLILQRKGILARHIWHILNVKTFALLVEIVYLNIVTLAIRKAVNWHHVVQLLMWFILEEGVNHWIMASSSEAT